MYRKMTDYEHKMIERLLDMGFKGKHEITQQLSDCLVKPIDENGSLEFMIQTSIAADVKRRIPVEAEVEDVDGITIHILLHVVNKKVSELEIYKEDSSRVIKLPDPATWRLLLLD